MSRKLDQISKNRPFLHYLLWRLGLTSALTQTTEEETRYLCSLASKSRRIIKIGVWHGVNTRKMAESMPEGGRLIAIDPFFTGRFGVSCQELIANRMISRFKSVRVLKMLSGDAINQLRGEKAFDMIFIDGDHTYDGVRADWMNYRNIVSAGGIVAFHDSRSHEGR